MKRMILVVVGVGLLTVGLSIVRLRTTAASAAVKEAEAARAMAEAQIQAQDRDREQAMNPVPVRDLRQPKAERTKEKAVQPRVSATSAPTTFDFNQAMETLVSPTSFAQRQAAWNGLKNSGQLDQAIHELEQRIANDPQRPEFVATLGEAYMKKCATMTDVREQAILAMQADKTLENALNLDPSNWEARFTRAVGLSFWPADLNKSPQVMHEFLALIQQQEAQPKEPQFAQPYIWLGKEYEKAGQAENAAQIWQRGAALFPDNKELQNKLAATQP